MKKINLKGISERLSEKELKNVMGGSGACGGAGLCNGRCPSGKVCKKRHVSERLCACYGS